VVRLAPQLQPDITEAETHGAQALHMRRTTEAEQAVTAALAQALAEFHRPREVGIFRDGGSIAIHCHSQVPAD